MSSSNLAVRMEHTASDLLSHPPRPLLRVVTRQRVEQVLKHPAPSLFHEPVDRHSRSGLAGSSVIR